MVTTGLMLDVRIYRSAFVPLLVAAVVVAFALGERPRPIGTTLAPDAFSGERAGQLIAQGDEEGDPFYDRRPGSLGDDALAVRAREVFEASGFRTTVRPVKGRTIDGETALPTVVGERTGRNERRILVIAERDAAEPGSPGRLSATAALLELARVFEGRATRRTLTLVSTSGGSGGVAGVRRAPSTPSWTTPAARTTGAGPARSATTRWPSACRRRSRPPGSTRRRGSPTRRRSTARPRSPPSSASA